MTIQDREVWIESILIVAGMVWVAYVIGFAMGGDFVRREAIRYGAAMEYVDTESGNMRFEWK